MPFGIPGRGFWLESANRKVRSWVTEPPLNFNRQRDIPSSTSPFGKMRLVVDLVSRIWSRNQ
jgi:hypothetical protein